jgi:hypothetical protein
MRVKAVLLGVLLILFAAEVAAATKTDGNKAQARADAAKQLSELALPSGATEVSADPSASSVLGTGASIPGTPAKYVVDDYRFWRVSGSPDKVASWIQAHAPANAPGSYGGSTSSGIFAFGWSFTYTSTVTLRSLDVQVTKAKGGGSAVRADGVAVWVPERPAWDYIPSSVHVLTIWSTDNGHRHGPTTIHHAREVERVVHFLNHAPVVPPIIERCGVGYSGTFRMIFRDRRLGATVARARVDESGCAFISVSVGGRTGPDLIGGPQLGQILSGIEHRSARG